MASIHGKEWPPAQQYKRNAPFREPLFWRERLIPAPETPALKRRGSAVVPTLHTRSERDIVGDQQKYEPTNSVVEYIRASEHTALHSFVATLTSDSRPSPGAVPKTERSERCGRSACAFRRLSVIRRLSLVLFSHSRQKLESPFSVRACPTQNFRPVSSQHCERCSFSKARAQPRYTCLTLEL
jgi:hypothetical protein